MQDQTIKFSDFETGEVHTVSVPLTDDPMQDVQEALIHVLQERICEYACFGFTKCSLEVSWPNGSDTIMLFNEFNSLKQYYRCTTGR